MGIVGDGERHSLAFVAVNSFACACRTGSENDACARGEKAASSCFGRHDLNRGSGVEPDDAPTKAPSASFACAD